MHQTQIKLGQSTSLRQKGHHEAMHMLLEFQWGNKRGGPS